MDKKKILIIEDERPVAKILAMKLGSEGFETTIVTNGEEGLQKIQEDTFDLIMLDLIMPKADGFSFLTKRADLNIETPAIVITNLNQEMDKKRALSLGATKYLVKTEVNLNTIIQTVKDMLS